MPSPLDNLLIAADEALRTLAGVATAARKAPEASRETALEIASALFDGALAPAQS